MEASGITAIFIFISGATLLIYSAEKLIVYLVGAARGLSLSLFLLAIIFTGIEFDDLVLGVALNLEGLSNVALGTVFGTSIAMSGIVLALAAILTPTAVKVPRDYLVIFAAAPLLMIVFVLTAPLTFIDGVLLVALFAVFIGYVSVRETRRDVPMFRNAGIYEEITEKEAGGRVTVREAERPLPMDMSVTKQGRLPGWTQLGLAVVALAGLVIGAATMSFGTEGILDAYEIDGTLFGVTVVTLVLSIEDIFLTVEPVRKGVPLLGVGNVIGSVVFSVTGKLGIILLAGGSIMVGPDVLRWHLPALIVLTGMSAYFLYTGRLRRWRGYTLLVFYLVYWVASFTVFGGVPLDD